MKEKAKSFSCFMEIQHGHFFIAILPKHFSKDHRVIVPDHIGCGLSDKPQDYEYTLKSTY